MVKFILSVEDEVLIDFDQIIRVEAMKEREGTALPGMHTRVTTKDAGVVYLRVPFADFAERLMDVVVNE